MATPAVTIDRALPGTRTNEAQDKLASTDSKKINYLNRCAVQIQPGTENYYRISGFLRQAAIAVGMIALVAFCVATPFIAAALPPIAAGLLIGAAVLSSLGLSFSAFVFREHFEMMIGNFTEPPYERAAVAKGIRDLYNELPTSAEKILERLKEVGINREDLDLSLRDDPTKLRPVLAHYLYWEKLSTEHSLKAFPLDIFDQSTHIHQEKALRAKARAAFYLGILKSPHSDKKFSDIVKFSSSSEKRYKMRFTELPREYVGAYQLKDVNDECMKIHSSPVSYKEIFELSIEDLSKKIFAADRS